MADSGKFVQQRSFEYESACQAVVHALDAHDRLAGSSHRPQPKTPLKK